MTNDGNKASIHDSSLKQIPYKWWSNYSSPDPRDAEKVAEAWEAIIPDHGIVAVDHQWAAQRLLPASQDFSGDPSKGLYLLEAYHQMHCIV